MMCGRYASISNIHGVTGDDAMKNRDQYILKRNEHDMLIKIQATMLSHDCCVIDALTGVNSPCDKCCMLSTCEACIREWLNEEN